MSNDNNSPPPTPSVPSARRASFSPGQKLSELFGRSPTNSSGPSLYPSPIATAAANAQAQQRRRMSITSLGLSGSPTQPSTFSQARARQDSLSSGCSIDENAVDDSEPAPNGSPTSPFARRMSFGARALRDVKTGNGVGNNGRVSVKLASPPPAQGRGLSSTHASIDKHLRIVSDYSGKCSGEGFNWSEQLRSRAERSSFSVAAPPAPAPVPSPGSHQRTTSVVPTAPAVKEIPKGSQAPDHFQERILKGDFYMD